MVTKNYMAILADVKCADPNGNVFNGIWQSYERVVLHSLVTSFGLDFLVQDQQGGDVDSIRSVRSSGFKSDEHRAAYEARGGYDTRAYHTHPQYFEIAQSARRTFNETGEMQQDAYVSGNTVAYSRASALGKDRRANLDHVISAHEIHEDPGRVLAGLDGRDLANSPENLRFTNESLNKSKSDMTVEEFLDKKGVSVPEDVQQQMRAVDQEARDAYNAKLEAAYYTSSDFWGDAIAAAVVQAANVLLFNPNDLLLGDRIEAATVILGTGASVLVGTKVGDLIAKTPLGADPIVGTPIRIFCSTMVSGLISCTLLLVLDRSKFINKAITALNMYLTENQSFRQIAYDFETYAARIAAVDVEQFRKDTESFQNIADEIYMADDDEELEGILVAAFEALAIPAPWSGDFDEFMGNPNNKLIFG